MQDTHKQEAAETIVGNNCHQVVDGGDQGTGSYSRVHMNLLEKQRDAGSHRPGNDHGQHQGKADTAGHRVSKTEGLALVPTLPAMSRIRDWKHMRRVSWLTTCSNPPTTEDTTMPRPSSIRSQGRRFLMLSFKGSFKSSSAVRPANFA